METKERGAGIGLLNRRQFLKGAGGSAAAAAAYQAGLLRWRTAEAAEAVLPGQGPKSVVTMTVNGLTYKMTVENRETLAEVLREQLMLTGTKVSCDRSECGACTVIMDGRTVYACSMLAVQANGKSVTTIEGIASGGTLHPVQQAFIDNDALQCGYCTPGQVIAVKDLLDKNPNPTKDEVLLGLSGNMCRCCAYPNIVNAALDAAKRIG